MRWGTEAFGHCSCWEGFNLVGLQTWRVDYCGRANTTPIWPYPLVNVYITNWKDPPCYSWENPLFLWSFSIVTLNYQRVLCTIHFWSLWVYSCRWTLRISGWNSRNSTEKPGLVESGKAEHRKPTGFHIFIHIYGSVRFYIFPSIQWASNSHPWMDSTKKTTNMRKFNDSMRILSIQLR